MNLIFLLAWLMGTLLPLGALGALFRGLRRERCFGYNRALLLLAPAVAALLPLLPRPAVLGWRAAGEAPTAARQLGLLPVVSASARPAILWEGLNGLAGLYLLGVGVALVWLAYRYGQLRRATRYLPREQRPGYALARTGGRLPTSSFGRTIFWDETAGLAPVEEAAVLAHELAHVRQGHSYDVLWLEGWRAVLWPNPFIHLLLPALRLTHELLADQAAAPSASAGPAAPYPALLARLALRGAVGPRHSLLLQPFIFSFTLTRIAMLDRTYATSVGHCEHREAITSARI